MEFFYYYKGYGIRYLQIGGTTLIEDLGLPIKEFLGKGELEGEKLAKAYIDAMDA